MSAENKQVDIARIEKAVGEILLGVGEDPRRETLPEKRRISQLTLNLSPI